MEWQEAVESGCDESIQPVFNDLMFQWLGGPLSKGESGLSAGNREDFRQVVGKALPPPGWFGSWSRVGRSPPVLLSSTGP